MRSPRTNPVFSHIKDLFTYLVFLYLKTAKTRQKGKSLNITEFFPGTLLACDNRGCCTLLQ